MGGTRVLVNPAAGGGHAGRIVARWQAGRRPSDIDVVSTRSPEDLTRQAARAVSDGIERLVVVGGDGSVHRVLEPLSDRATALGLVPVGTGNDLARALGIAGSPTDCMQRAVRGPIRRIDLGEIEGRVFAGVAGVGFVDAVAARVRSGHGKWLGPFAYAAAALRELRTFEPAKYRVDHDTGTISEPTMLVLWANSTRFGGGMRVAPDARLDDGLLDLVVLRACSRFELVRALPKVFAGRHVGHPKVDLVRTARSTLHVDRPTTVWADGEPVTQADSGTVRFAVRPRALAVVA